MNDSISFTEFEYMLYTGLLIVNFILLSLAVVGLSVLFYLIIKVPQFHLNLKGMFGNIIVAFLLITISRASEIIASRFDVYLDEGDWSYDHMPFHYWAERVRDTSIVAYVVIIPSLAIERTMATLMLNAYEKYKTYPFLILMVAFQWIGALCINFLLYNGIMDNITWAIIIAVILLVSISWQIILNYINHYRYKNRLTLHYNLRERFQLSENIRFLKMIKWVALTMTVCDAAALSVYFWLYSGEYVHFRFTIYNFALLSNSMMFPLVAISTNTLWKRELIRLILHVHAKISPLNRDASKEHNHRFSAPHLKTISGKPMVFSAEQEKELYFKHLKANL